MFEEPNLQQNQYYEINITKPFQALYKKKLKNDILEDILHYILYGKSFNLVFFRKLYVVLECTLQYALHVLKCKVLI